MALGTNIKKGSQVALRNRFWALLGHRKQAGSGANEVGPRIVYKNGAPASNTAADDPGAKGVVILDMTNLKIYICTAYTNSTTFTISSALN